jgi:hypothetical protein
MRFSTLILALAATASARTAYRRGGKNLVARGGELDVPGENPLQFCDSDRRDDIITIDEVILSPNPPEA